VDARLLGPDDGEAITDRPERDLRILVGEDAATVTKARYGGGQDGASAHIHREHSDAFYVLEGTMALLLGDREHVLEAGSFAVVPPGVVHGFRNGGEGDMRHLNVHAPSGGFHESLRARRDGREDDDDFDTFDPPPDGGRSPSEALVCAPGAGEELRMGASTALIKAGVHDAGGRLALLETAVEPGFPGPVPHRHQQTIDSFWILEGTLRMRLGDEESDAGPGSYAVAPPGTVHTFSNPGSEPVRMLNLMIPGGLEEYLREVHAALRPGEAADPEVMARIAARYDFLPAS
jgi:mannose-6-phosphate isomerase-like protein (cupin superfamily)